MAHWDVSSEVRGEHGKWTKGGAALKRMAEEAASGKASKATEFQPGDKVKYRTGASGVIHHVDDKGTPHVVWDRGRGKPVRTPAHHLTHAGAQVSKPGSVTHEESALTPSEERIREESLRKLAGAHPASADWKQKIAKGLAIRDNLRHSSYVPTDSEHRQLIAARDAADVNLRGDDPQRGFLSDSIKESNLRRAGQAASPVIRNKPANTESEMSRADLEWRASRGDQAAQAELMKRITAEQSAKTEAENKGRGGVTELTNIKQGMESPEYLAKLPGGGAPSTGLSVDERVKKANFALSQARQRIRGARGPTAMQSAQRAHDAAEAELRSLGAVRTGPRGREYWKIPSAAAIKKASDPKTGEKKVNIRDLPAEYHGADSGATDFKGQRVIEIHDGNHQKIAELHYHEFSTPVTEGGLNVAVGSTRTKGYTYKLTHPDAIAGAQAVASERGGYAPSVHDMLNQPGVLAKPLSQSASAAINRHNSLKRAGRLWRTGTFLASSAASTASGARAQH